MPGILILSSAPENTGLRIFEIAESFLSKREVELCHPELIRKRSLKKIHPKQWHLKTTTINGDLIKAGVKADSAHKLTMGENIIIALIDDGFDIDHPEFNQPGKVVHSRDVSSNSNDPRPKNVYNNHGTACAGVATAAGINASGVAPAAMLMPVRLSSNLGSMAEANAFKWAADHGADIISCSWGPEDGNWSDPDDPVHTSETGLPDSTRLAMDYAISNGRNGKGCIITFAAGNGNEDVKYDGYASYDKVIAVSACNDTGKRSVYSDYGESVWCSFPSSDFGYPPFNHPDPLTTGIYTTDRIGKAGYNPDGDYTDDFGGTSSSCPGVAGTVALILSANPDLNWQQVRDILKDTSEKIDKAGGKYDKEGHSIFYGYGRVDAEKAVKRALELKSWTKEKGQKEEKESLRFFNYMEIMNGQFRTILNIKIFYMAREVLTLKDIQEFEKSVETGQLTEEAVYPAGKDKYVDRLFKYIPAELVAGYIFVLGVVKRLTDAGEIKVIHWLLFIVFCVLTPLYLWRVRKSLNSSSISYLFFHL